MAKVDELHHQKIVYCRIFFFNLHCTFNFYCRIFSFNLHCTFILISSWWQMVWNYHICTVVVTDVNFKTKNSSMADILKSMRKMELSVWKIICRIMWTFFAFLYHSSSNVMISTMDGFSSQGRAKRKVCPCHDVIMNQRDILPAEVLTILP